jgi:hypothetical protein
VGEDKEAASLTGEGSTDTEQDSGAHQSPDVRCKTSDKGTGDHEQRPDVLDVSEAA